jgi:D-tyrosyl-tRNA(Tyr) deacylase
VRTIVQRVSSASVRVAGKTIAEIGTGYLVLAGIMREDDFAADVRPIAEKLAEMRVFGDTAGKMNRSLRDVEGSILVVSQFTLAGSLRSGRRPEFLQAEEPARARALLAEFTDHLRRLGCSVQEGEFGAHMEVALVNDGPVTLWLDSRELGGRRAP